MQHSTSSCNLEYAVVYPKVKYTAVLYTVVHYSVPQSTVHCMHNGEWQGKGEEEEEQ